MSTTDLAPTVDARVSVEINRLHSLAKTSYQSTINYALECGRLLAETKRRLGHGGWLPWLAENFDGDRKTASDYMRLAAHITAERPDGEHAPHLSIRAALRTISTPKTDRAKQETAKALFPGLAAGEASEPADPPVVDATVAAPDAPASLADVQRRKWIAAGNGLDEARALMEEATTDGLAPDSIASAVRDASLAARKGYKALEELAVMLDLEIAQGRAREAA